MPKKPTKLRSGVAEIALRTMTTSPAGPTDQVRTVSHFDLVRGRGKHRWTAVASPPQLGQSFER
jgi:hypothetical protein